MCTCACVRVRVCVCVCVHVKMCSNMIAHRTDSVTESLLWTLSLRRYVPSLIVFDISNDSAT